MNEETRSLLAPHMSSWPQWRRIANDLEADILFGTIQPGTRLPSIRARAKELDVSDVKIQYAYRSLAERNLVVSQGRAGTRVSVHAASPDDIRELARSLSDQALQAGMDLQALEGTIRGAWRQQASASAIGDTAPDSNPFDPTFPEPDETLFFREDEIDQNVIGEQEQEQEEVWRAEAMAQQYDFS